MRTDWKDVLNGLRGSLEDPESEEKTDIIEEKEIQQGLLKVFIDKKGRHGKTATIIEGFTLPQERIEDIAGKIKKRLGVGGSTRNNEILIQGEYKEKVVLILKELGLKAK